MVPKHRLLHTTPERKLPTTSGMPAPESAKAASCPMEEIIPPTIMMGIAGTNASTNPRRIMPTARGLERREPVARRSKRESGDAAFALPVLAVEAALRPPAAEAAFALCPLAASPSRSTAPAISCSTHAKRAAPAFWMPSFTPRSVLSSAAFAAASTCCCTSSRAGPSPSMSFAASQKRLCGPMPSSGSRVATASHVLPKRCAMARSRAAGSMTARLSHARSSAW